MGIQGTAKATGGALFGKNRRYNVVAGQDCWCLAILSSMHMVGGNIGNVTMSYTMLW